MAFILLYNGYQFISQGGSSGSGVTSLTSPLGSIVLSASTGAITEDVVNKNTNLIYANSVGGSDSAQGSYLLPFATNTHAMSTISGGSLTNPFIINSTGAFTETTFTLKPFTHIRGNYQSTFFSLSSGITADSSIAGTNGAYSIIEDVDFTGAGTLNFSLSGMSGSAFTLYLVNCNLGTGITVVGRGSADTLKLINCVCPAGTIAVSGMNVTSQNNIFSTVTYNASGFGSLGWSSYGDNMTSQTITGGSIGTTTYSSRFCNIQNVTLSGANARFTYDAISYPMGTLTVGSGTATPLSTSTSILNSYSPVNWINTTTTLLGALNGIDNALGATISPNIMGTTLGVITGDTAIGTTQNTGRVFYPSFVRIFVQSSNCTSGITFSIGTTAGSFIDILGSTNASTLFATGDYQDFPLTFPISTIAANTQIWISITNAASGGTGTTFTIIARVFGNNG